MPKQSAARARQGGQVLAGVMMLVVLLLIIVPAMVQWVQMEAKTAVHVGNSTTAFNLAEAAVERGYWKVKSSTQNCINATSGVVISGYNNDTSYTEIPGGSYRIKFSSAGGQEVTIVGEGKDAVTHQVRQITAVFKNQTLASPILTTGNINLAEGIGPHWGPIMSQGNINLVDNALGNLYFPRKYAKGVVQCITNCSSNARDTNGLTPPNTDNAEWWSDYQYVPDLPVLDFAALRSSAAATGTLNVYGCKNSSVHMDTHTWTSVSGPGPWDGRSSCGNIQDASGHAHHFSASWNHLYGPQYQPNNSYVWYYDGDLILGGDGLGGSYGVGLRGSLIVRGNLTLDANGDYNYSGYVPVNAWAEYARLTKTTYDTNATGEYPADNGYQKTKSTWNFGSDTWCQPGAGCGWQNTVGMRGFTYVGGNLHVTNNGFMDFNGALWVNGSIQADGASANTFCGIYFDDTLQLPTLTVVLTRESWQETTPTSWP